MRPPEIRPFSDEDLDAAAALLAERHRRHRIAQPLLPPQFEQPGAARAEIEKLWRRDDASGWGGFRNGQLVAFLLGVTREGVEEKHVWIDYAAHASQEPEDVRDLY